MTTFCEGCPEKSKACGRLIGKVAQKAGTGALMLSKNWGFPMGEVGVMIDDAGRVSEPLLFSRRQTGRTAYKDVLADIEACQGPTELTGLKQLFKRAVGEQTTICPALQDIAGSKSGGLEEGYAAELLPSLSMRAVQGALKYQRELAEAVRTQTNL